MLVELWDDDLEIAGSSPLAHNYFSSRKVHFLVYVFTIGDTRSE